MKRMRNPDRGASVREVTQALTHPSHSTSSTPCLACGWPELDHPVTLEVIPETCERFVHGALDLPPPYGPGDQVLYDVTHGEAAADRERDGITDPNAYLVPAVVVFVHSDETFDVAYRYGGVTTLVEDVDEVHLRPLTGGEI